MDVSDLVVQGNDQQKRSKGLTLEQQTKFEELRGRRLQLQHAKDVANSRKKKRKRQQGNKDFDLHAKAADGGSEKQQDDQSVHQEGATTQTAAKFGSEQRHIFGVTAGTGRAGEGSVSQSSDAYAGEGSLAIIPFTTENSPSGMVVLPAKTAVGPPQKTKRKKLHWGMEIKERWERKANM